MPAPGHPDTDPAYAELAELLQALEAELRHAGVWEPAPPPAPALASPLPFCCDTLRFTQWLQWLFVPRTRALLDRHGHFPLKSAIRPMAEEALAGCDWDVAGVIQLLGRIDQVINCLPAGPSRAGG